ncbi:MAG: hypothetical protein ACYDGL_00710 [Bellilinea sp.]
MIDQTGQYTFDIRLILGFCQLVDQTLGGVEHIRHGRAGRAGFRIPQSLDFTNQPQFLPLQLEHFIHQSA